MNAQGSGRTLALAALPVVAIVAFVGVTATVAVSAGSLLGYDFQAYVHAAERLLAGERLYDPSVSVAGGFAIYLYPPPFAVAFIQFPTPPGAGVHGCPATTRPNRLSRGYAARPGCP